jgi:hypothetical protein
MKYTTLYILILTFPFLFLGKVSFAQGLSYVDQSNTSLLHDHLRPIVAAHYYEERFLIDSMYLYESDGEQEVQEWNLTSRAIFDHNNLGLMAFRQNATYNDGQWNNLEQILFTYNLGNELTEVYRSLWDAQDEAWTNDQRSQHYYTYDGMEKEVIEQAWTMDKWMLNRRTTKAYSEENNLNELIKYAWSHESNTWNPYSRSLYAYDEARLLLQEIGQIWDTISERWINDRKRSFEYDEDNNLIESLLSAWSPETGAFIEALVTVWDYNNAGLPEGTAVTPLNGKALTDVTIQSATYNDDGTLNQLYSQRWDEASNSWENFRYEENFWSRTLVGNPNVGKQKIDCLFANPYTIGLPMFCETLKEGLEYTAEVYDLLGRKYASIKFMGGNSFRFNTAIPSGIYVVVISGGFDLHTEKVIIR